MRDAPDFADPRSLPPGQRREDVLRTTHYGRVPTMHVDTWRLTVGGATAAGRDTTIDWDEFSALPRVDVRADLHCVARFSTLDLRWSGVAARTILDLAPPADDARYAVVYAMYGYSASVQVDDLASPRALFATHLDGEPLRPENGWPVRLVLPHLYGWKGPKWVVSVEYHRRPTRGFWEQRGYHLRGDVWREERYAHQE